MTCNPYGMLWPVPNGKVELSNEMVYFYPGDISIIVAKDTPWKPTLLAVQLIDIFNEYLYTMHPQYEIGSGERPFKTDHSDTSIKVHLNIESNETRITMETDESYKLNIKDSGKEVE